MNIKLIIFDFDGTIMDTKNTIIAAKQETLRQMGVDVADEQTCASTIGMSAKIGFQKLCPELSEDMIDLCMKKYREIFDEIKKKVDNGEWKEGKAIPTERSTRGKLLSYLSSQSKKTGSRHFFIPFNRQELADYLCVERSAMSAELSRLKGDGILDYKKHEFWLSGQD